MRSQRNKKSVSKSNGKSNCLNTWPLRFPVPHMQNCLAIGHKIVSCDRTFRLLTKYSKTRVRDFSVWMMSWSVTIFACFRSLSNETEILLKVALNTITLTSQQVSYSIKVVIFTIYHACCYRLCLVQCYRRVHSSIITRVEFE